MCVYCVFSIAVITISFSIPLTIVAIAIALVSTNHFEELGPITN